VLLQGGLHPILRVEYYETLLRSLKQRYPQVHLHCFSAPEILCIAEVSGFRCATPLRGCATPASIPFPEAAGDSRRRNSRAHFPTEVTSNEWEQMQP